MNINDFFNIKVLLPEYEIQEKIYNVLDKEDKKIEFEKLKKLEYEKLKRGLMQQLLTGKVDVNV